MRPEMGSAFPRLPDSLLLPGAGRAGPAEMPPHPPLLQREQATFFKNLIKALDQVCIMKFGL